MAKRKLKVIGYRTDGPVDAVTLIFNRELSPLEVAGVMQLVDERLSDGK